jgi:Domain of unknown function (DUF4388)
LRVFLNLGDLAAEAIHVSLEGTLETIALPDVLALLSVTSKTGELRVESARVGGSVWMNDGRVAGFEVGNCSTVADALFALLRLQEGNFYFRAESTEPSRPVPEQDVAPLLEEAEARLAEWPAISAVVPSLAAQLSLSASVGVPVSLQPAQWQLVASIGGGRSAGLVLEDLELGEFQGCKELAELIDLGLVEVAAAEGAGAGVGAASGTASGPSFSADEEVPSEAAPSQEPLEESSWDNGHGPDLSAFAPDLSEVWNEAPAPEALHEPEAAPEPEVEQEVEPEPQPEPEPVNRGLLLKFLGSARN